MKNEVDLKFENIYKTMEEKEKSDDTLNKKLLDKSTTRDDAYFCSSFFDCLSRRCCFFLYT
jgi:hypothetical protein